MLSQWITVMLPRGGYSVSVFPKSIILLDFNVSCFMFWNHVLFPLHFLSVFMRKKINTGCFDFYITPLDVTGCILFFNFPSFS